MTNRREGTKVTAPAGAPEKPAATLQALPLFAGLNPSAHRTLASRAVERRFAPDETLFLAGTPSRGLFVILEGTVRVLRTRDGRQHVIHQEGPGGTLGEVPLFDGGGYPATAVAATETRCALISQRVLDAAMADDRRLCWRLLERVARRVRGLVERIDALATRDVASRLAAHVLARCVSSDGRLLVSVGSTQGELAEEVGTVREVVARQVRALVGAGVLRRIGRGRYEVLDEHALRARAGLI